MQHTGHVVINRLTANWKNVNGRNVNAFKSQTNANKTNTAATTTHCQQQYPAETPSSAISIILFIITDSPLSEKFKRLKKLVCFTVYIFLVVSNFRHHRVVQRFFDCLSDGVPTETPSTLSKFV